MTDLKVPSRIAMVVGAGLMIGGAIRVATAPAELPMQAPGWFESVQKHGDAVFFGIGMLMVGFFLLAVGFMLSQRVRKVALSLTEDTAAAVARGLGVRPSSDTASRLAELEQLKSQELVTEAEYTAKRAAILDKL